MSDEETELLTNYNFLYRGKQFGGGIEIRMLSEYEQLFKFGSITVKCLKWDFYSFQGSSILPTPVPADSIKALAFEYSYLILFLIAYNSTC